MDATHRMVCQEDLFNPLSSMGVQVSFILVLSHFFHLVLKAFGQPGPIAQILAGMVLGPTGLSNIKAVRDVFFQASAADYYEIFGFLSRIIFMFLIGLETDFPYLLRNLRVAGIVACGGAAVGSVFGIAVSFFLYQQFEEKSSKFGFFFIIMLILSYTASPIVIRLAAELKFATSDVGKLAISSALINEMSCLAVFNAILALRSFRGFGKGIFCAVFIASVVILNKYLASWLNKRNRNQKYLKNMEVFFLLSLVIAASVIIELEAFNSIVSSFIFGVMFPKEGKSARTLMHKLTYSVHNFILPIYFGYVGFQFDGNNLWKLSNVIIVGIMVLLSIGSKMSGTLAACNYLNIPLNEGVFLGFVLNLKGHADLLLIGGASKAILVTYNLLLISIVINTIISGPIVALLMRREHKLFSHAHTSLEYTDPTHELRALACVYGPRHLSGLFPLLSSLSGGHTSQLSPFLLHLIELLHKRRTNVSYHELEQDELSDDEGYGGNDVLEVHCAIDAFISDTKIFMSLSKAISAFPTLYEDVCNAAEDLRVSIVILPFHKHQRIDGKMESGKEGIRTTNQKILRHAPCSVGILVDRVQTGFSSFSHLLVSDHVQHVATLFFGGPDDREALAWSRRMISHSRINLTVIRFVPTATTIDAAATASHVSTGQVGYVEKQVKNGEETVAELRDIGDMYSLFIVGKGGRGHSTLTTGMSDWEECPELGTVGDLLASSDFNISGSVLIVQQHRHQKKDLTDD
ncbi:cation/H(+) antiporter 1-like [Cucumis melo var. makuwa]|uniref:Cation/H(+) antiporter 1-like n=1 Tax=Cucumis melo var. makuwa TaxID=1194695 RepID=A0A5A7TAY8_CUCMM|nr:cation/H(+) antiporter 1-like [Cucumis melo var. makuwa]